MFTKATLQFKDVNKLRTWLVLGLLAFFIFHFLLSSTRDVGLVFTDDIDCLLVQSEFQDRDLNFDKNAKVIALMEGEVLSGHLQFRPYLNCLHQEDKKLAGIIKENYLSQPSDKPYNFSRPLDQLQFPSESKDVLDLVFLPDVPQDGFFLELGSANGETRSVSLEFEVKYGWKGLLLEAVPIDFKKSLATNRKAFQMNTCVGVKQHPYFAMFDRVSAVRKNNLFSERGLGAESTQLSIQMQCFPLYSIIQAIGNPKINLLIMDVEGAEYQILQTIPWDKVDIEVMTVETDLIGEGIPGGNQAEVRKYMESQGYVRFPHRAPPRDATGLQQYDMFVRKDIVAKYNVL